MSHPLQRRKNFIHNLKTHQIDLVILGTVIGLVIIGLIMVYDSSVAQAVADYGDKYHYIKQQLIWVVLGLISLAFFSSFDYHVLKKLAPSLFLGSLLLLLLASIPGLGSAGGGAHRWLKMGPFTLQPSEIIKLTSIIFFAALFEKKTKIKPFLSVVGAVLVIVGLFQKDLGTAIVYFLLAVSMYVISGAPLRIFGSLIPISLLGLVYFINSSSYRLQRIKAFLDPFADPQGFTYHISQVLIALGSGGLIGLGIGQSRQKYEYIPEVSTDSIFAIVGEEFGFLGSIILISLFAFLVLRGLKIAQNCHDDFGRLLGFGLIIWIGIQAVINLAAMVSLIPLTGVPLPFISYGGSALLANLVAVGIILNISKHSDLAK